MIIVRSPLRITLGGGGTDLPSYYREHGGFLIAAAIDKYVYITVHQTFIDDLIVKYSELERVGSIDELKHPIIREAFKVVGLDVPLAGNHLDGRHPGRHGARLLGKLHHGAAQGAATATARSWSIRASSPSRPATSRSTGCASRSASRTSTSRPSAA